MNSSYSEDIENVEEEVQEEAAPEIESEDQIEQAQKLNMRQGELKQIMNMQNDLIKSIKARKLAPYLESMLILIRKHTTREQLLKSFSESVDRVDLPFIKGNKLIPECIVNVISDDVALVEFAKMFDSREKFYVYIGIVIFTFLMSYGIKKAEKMTRVKRSTLEKFKFFLFRFFFVNAIRLFTFLVLFYKNVMPMLSVIYVTIYP